MKKQTVLENKIRVVTHKMEGVRSISMGFLFDASPSHEQPGKSGVAHLTEHLMFKGTTHRDGDEIARMMDATGGSMGAFTSRDYTCYSVTVLDDYRTYAIDLLGDMLLHSTCMPADVNMEKNSIEYELAMANDRPDSYAHDRLKGHAWQGHPLGRPIGGTEEMVKQLSRDDVVGFIEKYYRGDRLIVAAAGNLDHSDFVANVHDALWEMQSSGATNRSLPQPSFTGGLTVGQREVNQTYFSLGLNALQYVHTSRYVLHLFTLILGGGISSRLHRRLRQTQGLVYEINAEYHAYRDAGILVIEGATTPELMEMVMTQVLHEMKGLGLGGSSPITEEELWKAKMQLKGQHLMASESTHSSMSSLATQAFYFDAFVETANIISSIEQITVADINAFASELLCDAESRIAVSLVGPPQVMITKDRILEALNNGFNDKIKSGG